MGEGAGKSQVWQCKMDLLMGPATSVKDQIFEFYKIQTNSYNKSCTSITLYMTDPKLSPLKTYWFTTELTSCLSLPTEINEALTCLTLAMLFISVTLSKTFKYDACKYINRWMLSWVLCKFPVRCYTWQKLKYFITLLEYVIRSRWVIGKAYCVM